MPLTPFPITGIITDIDGTTAKGVPVVIYNLSKNSSINTKTNTSGAYAVDLANVTPEYASGDILLVRAYSAFGNTFKYRESRSSVAGSSRTINLTLLGSNPDQPDELPYSNKDVDLKEHHPTARAKKIIIMNEDGNIIDSTNPLSVTSVSHTSNNLEGGGKISVGTTAVEVTFSGATEAIIITADKDNTGLLFVGKSNVTNAGANAITYLESGDQIVIDYNDSTNAIYVVSDTASQNFWKGAAL